MGPAPPNGLPPPMIRPNGHLPMMPPGPMPHEPRFGPPPPISDPHFGPPGYGPRPGPMPGHPYGPPPPFSTGIYEFVFSSRLMLILCWSSHEEYFA